MFLITADTHFTSRQRDTYRFGLFKWLKEQAQEHNVHTIMILGDLTDTKDDHSSILVNAIINGLSELVENTNVIILCGNHDFSDPKLPYFLFLNEIPGLRFINNPKNIKIQNRNHLFLPHTKDVNSWLKIKNKFQKADYIFMHQTVNGALASNGYTLPGIGTKIFKHTKAYIYSGDIHVPQRVGPVTYVGSPYTVRFNDEFDPRVLLIDDDKETEFDSVFSCLRRHTITISSVDEIQEQGGMLIAGDQIKIIMKMEREDIARWPTYRKQLIDICQQLKFEIFGIRLVLPEKKRRVKLSGNNQSQTEKVSTNPERILKQFCKREKLARSISKSGIKLLRQENFDV